jgi:hypothetical protein
MARAIKFPTRNSEQQIIDSGVPRADDGDAGCVLRIATCEMRKWRHDAPGQVEPR